MADYWGHWLEMGKRASQPPAIFQVNWFRTDERGRYIWPGFGENMRVLRWVREQVLSRNGASNARETPVGIVPTPEELDLRGMDLRPGDLERLLTIDTARWRQEMEHREEHLSAFAGLPEAIWEAHRRVAADLDAEDS
jgi:phosphoenolpyruvate carboxykinase (GTP)